MNSWPLAVTFSDVCVAWVSMPFYGRLRGERAFLTKHGLVHCLTYLPEKPQARRFAFPTPQHMWLAGRALGILCGW